MERVAGEGGAGAGTGDGAAGAIARGLADDLRAAREALDAARADAAELRVLLGLRTHQHDLAWQSVRRLEGERDALVAAAEDRAREAAGAARSEAEERLAAMRAVIDACLASAGPFGLRRRRFRELVTRAGARTPTSGPQAVRHAVLLAESRRVLEIPD